MQKQHLFLGTITLLSAMLAGCGGGGAGAATALPIPNPPGPPSGTQTALVAGDLNWQYADDAVAARFDGDALGALDSPLAKLSRLGSAAVDSHRTGDLAWGRWQGAGATFMQTAFAWQPQFGLQYAVFNATPALPATGNVGYHLYGGTAPMAGGVAGQLLSAKATAQFGGDATTVGLEFALDAGGTIQAGTIDGAATPATGLSLPLSQGGGRFLTMPLPDRALADEGNNRYDGAVEAQGVLPCAPAGQPQRCALRASAAFSGPNADYLVIAYTIVPAARPHLTALLDSSKTAMSPDNIDLSSNAISFNDRTLFKGNWNLPANLLPPKLDTVANAGKIGVSGILILQRD